jgi:pyruvate, water dikinase
VDVKEDALFARLEAEAKDYMLSRLRILGYLTIHTRQPNMIMLNEADVQMNLPATPGHSGACVCQYSE